MRRTLAALAMLALSTAHAVQPDERLSDPALEARARDITAELRCVVCQGQTVDESNAPAAEGVRRLVRARLAAGDSDAAVLDAVTSRYGDQVRLDPRLKPSTWLLWFGPVLLLGAATFAMMRFIQGQERATGPAALSPQERAELDRALRED